MSRDREAPVLVPQGDDQEILALIESWRYAVPPTPWEAVVGHDRQALRCQELLAKLERTPDELAHLRIRLGAGVLLSGPAGVGKTLLARALATAAGRIVVVPPVGELSAGFIRRLYGQLAKLEPSIVILDEAEGLIGRSWLRSGEDDAYRAMLAALDGVSRPQSGPITLALTTEPPDHLEPAAIRPGRLAPHLVLGLPDSEERRRLFARATEGLPLHGPVDLGALADRTAGWSGAMIATAVSETCARSLTLPRNDPLADGFSMLLALDIVGENYEVRDVHVPTEAELTAWSRHEAGHVLVAELLWPGGVESVVLSERGGRTMLAEAIENDAPTAERLRGLAMVSFGGEVAEQLLHGEASTTAGAGGDREQATAVLLQLVSIGSPLHLGALEEGSSSDRGSERMRADLYTAAQREGQALQAATAALLAPHRAALVRLAAAVLAAPDRSLSGEPLRGAVADALSQPQQSRQSRRQSVGPTQDRRSARGR